MKRDCAGFTLAELLIVVAVIAVLTSVAVPVFSDQLEKSRESTDFANVRSMYIIVINAVNADDGSVQFNGSPIKQSNGVFRATLTPLKQQKDGWTTNIDTMSLGGVPSSDWRGEPHENGACTLTYNAATGKMDVLWSSGYTYMPLSNLHEVSNAKRVKEDQKTLKNLGQKILEQGWTLNQLRDALAIPAAGSSNTSMRIADYYQLKNGVDFSDYSSAGFKLESNGDKLAELLRQIGYDGGSAETSPIISNGRTSTTYENSLFYSDQLASNQYADSSGQTYGIDQNKRSIILEKISTDKNGKITGFTIFTKAMDGQANMGDDDKKLFRFDIK